MNLAREDEYLDEQARQAKAAMGNALAQAGRAIDPRHWTVQQRWIALGIAAAAGFAGGAFIPRRQPVPPPAPQRDQPKQHRLAALFKIILEVASIARPLFRSILAAFLADSGPNGKVEPDPASTPDSQYASEKLNQ
jgi:hypothetical protein